MRNAQFCVTICLDLSRRPSVTFFLVANRDSTLGSANPEGPAELAVRPSTDEKQEERNDEENVSAT